jgi:hypothetical protein
LSLFFIPLFRVKQGEHFLECDRCGIVSDAAGKAPGDTSSDRRVQSCGRCGRRMEAEFQFCPYCGERVS